MPEVIIVLCVSPGRTYAESGLMLARVRPSGLFELLSADAWARVLGNRPEELRGKPLRELMHEKPATCELVAALLDGGYAAAGRDPAMQGRAAQILPAASAVRSV